MADTGISTTSDHGARGGRQSLNAGNSHTASDARGRGQGRGRWGQRGGRSRGRGQARGYSQNVAQSDKGANSVHDLERPPGGSGQRLTGAASQTQDDLNMNEDAADKEDEEAVDDDAEVCFICASPIEHLSVAPCNHQTCHICSLRLRALYKTRACAHCRTEAPFVVFTDNAEKKYQNFDDSEFVKIDENLGIKYEKDVILEDTILLLRYNCPDKSCDVACLGWPDLHRHVKSKHAKIMCDLCTRNKKVFTHEHELFTFGELRRHEKFGDDKPGAEDQSGFKGHPECGFCKQRFYGDDELYTHCREKHERCHICDRRNGGRNPQYYLNYEELEKHFADQHFVCMDAECQANKTNVFESEMDLKAHQLSEHPHGISKGRESRLVNLSGFDLRTPYQPQRRGGREGRGERGDRGNGRGRDPNAEPLPVSSAQSLSRAELAYQRTMAIQNASAGPGRTFGGSLTQQPTPAQAARSSAPTPARAPDANPVPAMDSLTLDSAPSNTNMTAQEQARYLRHQAVNTRATTLLQNNQTKLSQFRTHVSAYRSGTMTPADLIDAFFGLFDCPSSELGKLIRELADLYEDDAKKTRLLEAWNNWRSINEDYPSLPGPAGSLPGSSAGGLGNISTGRRVLKLKSSTAQSSRSAVSRQGSWGNALSPPATGGPREAFPALSSVNASARSGASMWGPAPGSTPAASVTTVRTTASRVGGSNNRTNITSSRPPPTMSNRQNEDMFPSLPAAVKPNVMIAGLNTRGSAKWGASGASSPNPWGSGAGTPQPQSQEYEESGGAGKKKGKKGKKGETLFHFG